MIWAMWQASGLADPWRRAALSGSLRADRDLDAVVALSDAAANNNAKDSPQPANPEVG